MENTLLGKNSVHEFGYNSAESKPIWNEIWSTVGILLELALADFGRYPRSSDSLRGRRYFVFFVR